MRLTIIYISSFAVTGPPYVSLHFNLFLPRSPFQAAYFTAIASCVSALSHVSFKSSDEEKEMFFSSGRTASCDLKLSRHRRQCKISIMIPSLC